MKSKENRIEVLNNELDDALNSIQQLTKRISILEFKDENKPKYKKGDIVAGYIINEVNFFQHRLNGYNIPQYLENCYMYKITNCNENIVKEIREDNLIKLIEDQEFKKLNKNQTKPIKQK